MSTLDRVKKVVAEQLERHESEIEASSSFEEDLGADSLAQVELIMAFEEAFEIEIPDEDAEKIETIQDAVSYIDEKTKQ